MTQMIILHGTLGSPTENWFAWLAAEMLERDYEVFVPQLPTPEGQNLEAWLKIAKKFTYDENTILIGHSCGGTLIPHILHSLKKPIKQSIIVSPCTTLTGDKRFDPYLDSFVGKNMDYIDYTHCQKIGGRIDVIAGDDDPYVAFDNSKDLSQKLAAKLTVIKGGGHLNAERNYTEFPKILEFLK